jgi:hypothetical protein
MKSNEHLPQQEAEELAAGERKLVIAARNAARTNRIAELVRIEANARRARQALQNEGLG